MLDPFVGSGTTIDVARQLGRNSVGIDLHPDYTSQIRERALSLGGHQVSWDDALEAMKATPTGWDSWPGNLKNLPKPGRSLPI